MGEEVSYKFLKNTPIGEDLFEGQSQEKIATVMADNIWNVYTFSYNKIKG